jgi:hypothetical protein
MEVGKKLGPQRAVDGRTGGPGSAWCGRKSGSPPNGKRAGVAEVASSR